mmetsp:Transcript_32801/g.75683  ORF Transcript_32801/g.75683 Transcript_32801/m.75683 type:complete len:221 (-) Transcript_32801:104-766(-)
MASIYLEFDRIQKFSAHMLDRVQIPQPQSCPSNVPKAPRSNARQNRSPLRSGPTPSGVPVKMRSPGSSSCEEARYARIVGTSNIMSDTRAYCRRSPLTESENSIAPRSKSDTKLETGAAPANDLAISHGCPACLSSFCSPLRVRSRPRPTPRTDSSSRSRGRPPRGTCDPTSSTSSASWWNSSCACASSPAASGRSELDALRKIIGCSGITLSSSAACFR